MHLSFLTRLHAVQLKNCGSKTSYPVGTASLFQGKIGCGVKLNCHLLHMLTLRMGGAILTCFCAVHRD